MVTPAALHMFGIICILRTLVSLKRMHVSFLFIIIFLSLCYDRRNRASDDGEGENSDSFRGLVCQNKHKGPLHKLFRL